MSRPHMPPLLRPTMSQHLQPTMPLWWHLHPTTPLLPTMSQSLTTSQSTMSTGQLVMPASTTLAMPTPPTLSSAAPTSPSPPACTLTLNPGVRRIAFATTEGTDLREPVSSAPTEHSSIRPCSGASSGTQLTAAQPSPSTAGFVCPNGTLFDQTLFRCEFWHTVDCSAAVSLYSLNADPLLNPYLPKPILDEYGN